MKLRLNQTLRAAILSAMAVVMPCTYADTTLIAEGVDIDNVMNSTRFYDTGKGYYFSWSNYWQGLKNLRNSKGSFAFLGDVYERMPANTTTTDHDSLTNDANTCWAQVSMNMVEYWHSYYGIFCNDSRELTYGLCYDKKYLDETGGTLSLKQNLVFLDTFSNTGDNLWSYLDWVMLGDDQPYFSTIKEPNQGGFWTDYFTTSYSTRNWYAISAANLNDIDDLTSALLTTLGYVKNTDGTYTQRIKGQIVYLGLDSTDGGHAITCHGVELNENGKVKAVYVTNSDDLEYKLFKLYLKEDSTRFLLYTNEQCTKLWEYAYDNWHIDSVGGIRTPEILQDMLAEYEDENNALVWTGYKAAKGVWDLESAPTTLALPDETSGWEIYAVDDYYAAYFDKDRIICFDDYASSGAVNVKNSGTAYRMELSNKTLAYTFTGEGNNTLTVDTLIANGGGKASFNKIQLTTTASTISNHTVSMGSGATWLGNATVAANGTIDLAGGTLSLTQLMLKGGTLSISSTGSTLQSGTIAVTGGSTLLFAPTGTGNTPMLTIGSGVSFSGSALDICMGGNSLIVDTTYALISFENAATNWDTLFTTEQGELSYANNVLYLFYDPIPKLTWSNTNGTWSSTQWGSTYTESNGLRAEFTGSGTRTVTISGTVTPYSVKVDNTGSVTFSGSGNISGSATLKKDGSGVLTINTSNTYSGGSTLAAGTINVGHANALGTGEVTLKNGTLNLAGKAIANTLTVAGNATINGGSAYNGALVLESGNISGNELRLNKNATLKSGSISNILSGSGMVTKTGSNTTILRAANTYSGGTIINGGTLVAEHAKALGTGTITINQGTLDMSGKALANAINIGSGQAELLHTGNYSGALSLRSGTLTAAGGDFACGSLTLNGGKLLLSSEGVALDAPLVDVNGTLTISAATQIGFTDVYTLGTHVLFEFGSLSGNISNLTMIPQAGKQLEYNLYSEGNRILVDIKKLGALLYWQGKGIWSEGGGCWQQGKKFEQGDKAQFTQAAQVTLQGQLAPSVIIVDCAQAVTFTGTGSITGSADLTKENAGVFTLNAANPEWSGDIYLKSGTITATGNTSFGTGEIHASGGTLNLAGKAIDNDIYVTNNATVCILGGKKYTGSMDVMGNLAVKSNIHIAEGETLTLRNGKHRATVTGKGTMHITEGTVTLQTGKYSMNGITIDSKLIVNKQGLTLAKTGSFISINEDGNLTSSGKITGCQLSLYGGSLSMRNATPAAITLTGAFYAEDSATAQLYAAVKCDSFELNDSYFRIIGYKPQAITVAKAMSLTDGRGLTTNGKIKAGSLKVSNTTLTIDSAKAASLTLKDKTTDALIEDKSTVSITGKLTAAAGLSLTDATLTLAAPDAKNAPQAMSVKGKLNIKDGAELTTNGKVSAGWLDMDDAQLYLYNEKPQSLALTAKADAAKQPITNYITDSKLYLNGSMSVAADLKLNNTTIRLWDAKPAKPKALGLTVKGDLAFSGNSELYLSGALSAKNLTLGSGSIFMTGSKLQTIKVGNELTLNGGTELNLGFTVTQANVDKSKVFKLFTFKVFDADVAATDLYSLLGLSQELCTLDFDKRRKAITLVVNDMEEWNKQAATVQNAQPTEATAATAAAAEEVEDMLFAPAPVAAEMAPELQKVADTLVQCTWGTVGASRAFTDTIANRGAYSTLFAGGRGAAWVSTMGGSSRISSDGAHAGADYTLTGAAFGMETNLGEQSTIGLAIGNSWGKVSTFSAFPVDQDSTHQGIYGKHLLGSSTTLSWMAAHTRTESDANLAGMACDWTQDALQLDARVDKLFAISDRTTVSAFVGMQYLATDKGECNGLSTGSLQNLRGEIGVSAAHKATDKAYIYGELSFIGDMVRHNPTATVGDYRSRGANPGRAGLNLSVGASYQLNDSWSLNGSYNLELMQNQTSHSANVGATYSF